jgi:Fic/DOC family
MQKRPERRVPTILFTRATSEWISRVNQKHKQLAELQLSARQRETLDRWAETEFLYSTLRLEGVSVAQEQLKRLASAPASWNDAPVNDRAAMGLLASLRAVASLARERGKAAKLTGDLLLSLHSLTGKAPGFRSSAGDTRRLKPPRAASLPAMIDNACQWYTAESFTELHPIEQASIVFLRLIEMQPFEETNERTALVAASLFTLRTELPPIIIKPDMQAAYGVALDEGTRMNTKPMVELVAEAVERSIGGMLELAKQ